MKVSLLSDGTTPNPTVHIGRMAEIAPGIFGG